MQKYTIKWIGEPKDITTKYGVKQKFSIKVEGNDNYLGVWASQANRDWKIGQEIEGTITESAGRDGKKFFNFDMPKKNDEALALVKSLEITVNLMKRKVDEMYEDYSKKKADETRGYHYPEPEEEDISEIPFP